jgi:RNA polymerase sigma-70 factor (ECF subfamily)
LEPLNSKDIERLVNRLKTGDQGAFAEMYDRYSGAINGVITRIVRDTEASQDVLQDTFVKVWRNIQSYDSSKGSFFTWMLNIARNTSIDALRKLKKEGKTEIQNWDAAVGVIGAAQQNINSIGLRKLVEKLPDEQRIMIEYIYFQGYTQQEVADELNMPLGTVKTRTRLAMRELRKAFTLLVLWM